MKRQLVIKPLSVLTPLDNQKLTAGLN